MANFPALGGYPFGLKAPLTHDDVNQASEQMQKTVNATDGSAHAPTDVIAWSGANGGGFEFDTTDPFLFYGKLDVTTGLTCTAPIAGSVTYTSTVAVTIANATFSSVATYNTGTTTTFNGTAVCTFGSSTTVNLSGAVNVRGTMTVKSTAGGGPGHVVFQTDTDLTLNSGSTLYCFGTLDLIAGSTVQCGSTVTMTGGKIVSSTDLDLTGTVTHKSGTKPLLDPARTWHRRARLLAVSLDTGVPQAFGVSHPVYDAPTVKSTGGSSDPVIAYLDFEPPHGGIITAVAVRSQVASNPAGAITRATYELLKWDNAIDADATSLSSVAVDAHAADGSDWADALTTNLTSIDSSAVDRTHGYGVRITAGRVGGAALSMFYDVKITGTIAELNGQ